MYQCHLWGQYGTFCQHVNDPCLHVPTAPTWFTRNTWDASIVQSRSKQLEYCLWMVRKTINKSFENCNYSSMTIPSESFTTTSKNLVTSRTSCLNGIHQDQLRVEHHSVMGEAHRAGTVPLHIEHLYQGLSLLGYIFSISCFTCHTANLHEFLVIVLLLKKIYICSIYEP